MIRLNKCSGTKCIPGGQEDIRLQLNEKRQALHTELAKQTPDATTAMTLQKEISDLQAQFDEKRLTHILEMKKSTRISWKAEAAAGSFSPRTVQLHE